MMRRAALAAATAATSLLAFAAPASADSVVRWLTAQPCATADVAVLSTPDSSDRTVSGWIDPCQRPARAERFGFIYYVPGADGGGPHGYVYLERLRYYGTTEATPFEGLVDPGVASLFGSVLAICLATGPGKPIACIPGMRANGDTPPPPQPPIKELATLPVVEVPPGPGDPNCATCV